MLMTVYYTLVEVYITTFIFGLVACCPMNNTIKKYTNKHIKFQMTDLNFDGLA